jgi:hypothetical protein
VSDDPYSTDYHPPYSGPGKHGPVGHGSDFGVDLFELYEAGRIGFPTVAGQFYLWSTATTWYEDQIRTEAYANAGNPAPIATLLKLRQELEIALKATGRVLETTGETLTSLVDSYVRTDEKAEEEFNKLHRRHLTEFQGAPNSDGSTRTPFPHLE